MGYVPVSATGIFFLMSDSSAILNSSITSSGERPRSIYADL